ncbi:phytoene/squalene synthase family protein [Segnochrobactraceae bacterium EtOH-i3]
MSLPGEPVGPEAVAELVRAQNPDRWRAALFAPADRRPGLMALAAFDVETARVRAAAREALPGEIRLQWWRDAVLGDGHGDVGAHPVAAELLAAISRHHLPAAALAAVAEARIFDLYDDPLPTLTDLEGYCGETWGALTQLAALVLAAPGTDPGTGTAAGHAGIALGITAILRALPRQLALGQSFLPADVLARHGASASDWADGRAGDGLKSVVGEMAGHARHHLDRVRALLPRLPRATLPAFLTLALVPARLKRLERAGFDPFAATDIGPLGALVVTTRAALTARLPG